MEILSIDLIKIVMGFIDKYYYVYKHSLGNCCDTTYKSQDHVFIKKLHKVNSVGFYSSHRTKHR